AFASACAATLNQVLDRRIDEQMARTRARPLLAGMLTQRKALTFAGALGCRSDDDPPLESECPDGSTHVPGPARVRGDLHIPAQAGVLAEHRARRRRRRSPTSTGLGGGNRQHRLQRTVTFSDCFCLDAALFLVSRDRAAG